jgi:DNA-binding transcriptional regulator YhcF (GntR family)/transcriptional regulator with XRE-family HTH domain
MTVDGKRLPKYARVAAAVRGQIAEGTLRPGEPAPSGAALSRLTGYSTLTCRKALRVLVEDGVLTPGPSRNARPRVARPSQPPAERDLAAAARALSAGLAARRRGKGLTQPEFAGRVGVSVTTVGHAETGRLWQSREFWEQADAVLGAGGDVLILHDAYREASAFGATREAGAAEAAVTSGAAPPVIAGRKEQRDESPGALPEGRAVPACVMIRWSDGTVTTVRPPDAGLPGAPAATDGASPGAARPG